MLTWGGLRGGISVAMALSIPPNDSRSLVLTLTYFVMVFSILVQSLTVGRVIRMSGGPSVFSRTLMAPWMSDRKQVSHNVQDLRHSKDKRISRCLLSTAKSPKMH